MARVARPRGGNSAYLMGLQPGSCASKRDGRIIFTRSGRDAVWYWDSALLAPAPTPQTARTSAHRAEAPPPAASRPSSPVHSPGAIQVGY